MGVIDEIFSIIHKGPQVASQIDQVKLNTKTIAGGARDATFQFPVLVSNTIDIDMASTIVRTIEKSYVQYTQQWLSLNQTINITTDRNIVQYLKKFHQNVSFESAVKELLVDENKVSDYMERVEKGEYSLYTTKDKSVAIVFNTADRGTATMMESHKDFLKEHLSQYDLKPIPHVGDRMVTEASGGENVTTGDLLSAMIQHGERQRKEEEDEKRNNLAFQKAQSARVPLLNDKEVKKANDVMPYTISVRLMAVNDKNEFVQFMDFILGVKAILHPISSDEIIENVQRVLKNQNPIFKFIRWTTGEISLVKNLILNLDDIKSDALYKAHGRNPWFSQLKKLKEKRFGVHDFTVPHALIPNSTLVITQYEVDYLKNKYAINLEDVKIARRMIDSLFLMAFIIVDDGAGTVEILYKDEPAYQTYALETLERDLSMNSNKLGREIGRMISH